MGAYPRLCLNGKPYSSRLLDQGHCAGGLLTPPTGEAMRRYSGNERWVLIPSQAYQGGAGNFLTISAICGHDCLQDMVNNGDYNFLPDTACLPWASRGAMTGIPQDSKSAAVPQICQGCGKAAAQSPLHLCLTIFNRGLGTVDSTCLRLGLKSWTPPGLSIPPPLVSPKKSQVAPSCVLPQGKAQGRWIAPLSCRSLAQDLEGGGPCDSPEKTYGYGSCETRQELKGLRKALYGRGDSLPSQRACAPQSTPQVSDWRRINGVLTYDRSVQAEKIHHAPVAEAIKLTVAKLESLE